MRRFITVVACIALASLGLVSCEEAESEIEAAESQLTEEDNSSEQEEPTDDSTLEEEEQTDQGEQEDQTDQTEEDDPYAISSAEQLRELSANVAAGHSYAGLTFTLTQSIDLGGISDGQGVAASAFTPIGSSSSSSFKGQFEGGGYTISGLFIEGGQSDSPIGLFGYVDGGEIRNVTVSGVVSGSYNVGGVVGYAFSSSIVGCHNQAQVLGDEYSGGVVGEAYGSSISECSNSGAVVGSGSIGGVVGAIGVGGSITNSFNQGSVTGSSFVVGGVAGAAYESVIAACYNVAKVEGKSYVGGVAGEFYASTIAASYNAAEISGDAAHSYTGAIAGVIGTSATVENCYYDVELYGYSGVGTVERGSTDGSASMYTSTTLSEIFVTMLNNASYSYNESSPEIAACAWVAVSLSTPTLDFGAEPSYTE